MPASPSDPLADLLTGPDLSALTGPDLADLTGPDLDDLMGAATGALAEPEPDPLADVEYTGDLEQDARRELTALEQGFRDRARAEHDRFVEATDTEYWFAVCFRNRAAKDTFLRAAGLWNIGDKYLDGHKVARKLDIDLTPPADHDG